MPTHIQMKIKLLNNNAANLHVFQVTRTLLVNITYFLHDELSDCPFSLLGFCYQCNINFSKSCSWWFIFRPIKFTFSFSCNKSNQYFVVVFRSHLPDDNFGDIMFKLSALTRL